MSSHPTAREKRAVTLLVDEVERRTQIRWPTTESWPVGDHPKIWVGRPADAPARASATEMAVGSREAEGYRLRTVVEHGNPNVFVVGNDERGVLFGVGGLLRALEMDPGRIVLRKPLNIATAPKYPLRGHQISYRPKSNTYDGWTLPMREQYIRDLAVFGTNAVELIPPDSDDAPYSPHFTLPAMEMMAETSRLLDEYGLDVWLWYPPTKEDYAEPQTVEQALEEWTEVLARLPRLDGLFLPGANGKPMPPGLLFDFARKIEPILHRYHPRAEIWVSPQSFSQAWLDEFFALLRTGPEWLNGVVFGPSIRIDLPEFRRLIPARYGVRFYPDIAHSNTGQYPLSDCDTAVGLTHGREGINPRPVDETHIFRLLQAHAERGFITYSEGCNDDVNKIVWSSLGWNPEMEPGEIVREYARYFIGGAQSEIFAQGLLALEDNWRGQLRTNPGVDTTLALFQGMEREASPALLRNWRFQLALYRAYFDAYVRARVQHEMGVELAAMDALRDVDRVGSLAAMAAAGKILADTKPASPAPEWRARTFELGDDLFRSIRLQLSVSLHQASNSRRGATLDTIDTPLSNAPWLLARFEELKELDGESARRAGIEAILHWTDPGPGGFYDNFGDTSAQPHLVRGPGFATDPGFLQSSVMDFVYDTMGQPWRLAWRDCAETFYDTPLEAHYEGLDPAAHYRVRVMRTGEDNHPVRLTADDRYEIHPFLLHGAELRPVEFDIPREATHDGTLTLQWRLPPGVSKGAQCHVAEVWLIKQP